jgi:hypothetical protein
VPFIYQRDINQLDETHASQYSQKGMKKVRVYLLDNTSIKYPITTILDINKPRIVSMEN